MDGSGRQPQWFKGIVTNAQRTKDAFYRIRYDDATSDWDSLESESQLRGLWNGEPLQGHWWRLRGSVTVKAAVANFHLRSLQDSLHSGLKDNAVSTVPAKRDRSASPAPTRGELGALAHSQELPLHKTLGTQLAVAVWHQPDTVWTAELSGKNSRANKRARCGKPKKAGSAEAEELRQMLEVERMKNETLSRHTQQQEQEHKQQLQVT